MGRRPELRFDYIQKNARFARDLDLQHAVLGRKGTAYPPFDAPRSLALSADHECQPRGRPILL